MSTLPDILDKDNEIRIDTSRGWHQNSLGASPECRRTQMLRVRVPGVAPQEIAERRIFAPIEDSLQHDIDLSQYMHCDVLERDNIASILGSISKVPNDFEKGRGREMLA